MDVGGVGNKFFEGMINLSYMKKLKKRLLDTTDYFQNKGTNDFDDGKPITDERRVFYLNTAKYEHYRNLFENKIFIFLTFFKIFVDITKL